MKDRGQVIHMFTTTKDVARLGAGVPTFGEKNI